MKTAGISISTYANFTGTIHLRIVNTKHPKTTMKYETGKRVVLTTREARYLASLLFELEMLTTDKHTENMARKYKRNLDKLTHFV